MEELENVLAIPREEVILASRQGGHRRPGDPPGDRRPDPAAQGRPRGPAARASSSTRHYDAYKGVVCYVRLAEGTLHDHDIIRLMASGAETELLELGVFRPQLVPVEQAGRRRGGLRRHGPQERPRGAGGRHGDDGGQARGGAAAGLPGGQEPRVRGPLPAERSGLPAPPRRPREAAPQRRPLHLRAGELGRAGLRVPLRLPGPAPHGDRPGAPGARVQPRPDRVARRRWSTGSS